MSRNRFFLFSGVTILLVVIGVVSLGYFNKNNLTVPVIPEFFGYVRLPVSPNVKPVVYTQITYNFAGNITEILPSNTGSAIKLEIMPPGVNSFDICKICDTPTSVYIKKDNKFVLGSAKDLKVGIQALVIASYSLQKKTWSTFRVNIYPLK